MNQVRKNDRERLGTKSRDYLLPVSLHFSPIPKTEKHSWSKVIQLTLLRVSGRKEQVPALQYRRKDLYFLTLPEQTRKIIDQQLLKAKEVKPKNILWDTKIYEKKAKKSDFEVLPSDVDVIEEAKKLWPKRIAPDRKAHQQLEPQVAMEKLAEAEKKLRENTFTQ